MRETREQWKFVMGLNMCVKTFKSAKFSDFLYFIKNRDAFFHMKSVTNGTVGFRHSM